MNGTTSTVGEILIFLGGPLIWAAHFLMIYGAETLYCSSTSVRNAMPFLPYALLFTAIAVATLLILITGQLIKVGRQGPDANQHDGSRFLQRGSILLGSAALLAVLWSAIPTILIAACAGTVV